ncbi:MAG: protease inhibitor I42 family protein [Verrucomicrobiales bacterium]|nr:protease inhibitor I42 family protein [Verrucomicrobiales bacterium]
MKITKLALTLLLLTFGLNLQAQEGVTKRKPQPIFKAPNGKAFPANWGRPPLRQTRDLRPLPGGYGRGSGTLAGWIQENLNNDAKNGVPGPAVAPPVPTLIAPPRPVGPPAVFDPNAKAKEQAKVDTAKVKEGIKAWERAKVKSNGNYSYKIGFQSWVGFGHETTIVVRNNKVAERHFRTFNRARPIAPPRPGGGAPAQPKTISWVETGKAIGTNKGGAPAKTLDELYKIALETAQKPLKQFERRSIRSDKQGLLVSCYIMDRRIADDAPRNGLVVSSITLSKVGTASTNQGGVTRLTAKDNGKTITVKAGQRIEISLAGNPTTGFTWNNVTRGHGMKLLGEIAHKAGVRALGAPGMSTATFQAMKLGKNDISLEYRRVFEKNPPVKTFKVTVAVAEGGTGSTKPATGNNQARIAELKQEIARMKDFARRARFTPEGLAKHNAKLAELEKELATLQAGGSKLGNAKVYNAPNGKPFPTHWGAPPLRQTRDLRPLPGGYGAGSGTLAGWIQKNLNKDAAKPKPGPGNKQARIATLEKEIARMKDFARRARFTPEGFQKHKAQLAALEKKLAELKGGKSGSGKQTGVPTFEEWVKGGMKIPSGRVFIGGSPWFDESKGERRSPREVYKMLHGGEKPPVIKPRPRPNPSKGRFPAHWGAPPRIQTRDLRPLPGGYGRGSSTLAKWIQQNLAKDAANPNRGKSENTPAKPQSKRPALSPAFSAKHPGGTYATGELLVGVEKGLSKEDSENMLAKVIPGLKVKKAMINNTILHVTLPESTNVELAMAKLKTVKAVRYSELNGRVGIQPAQPGGVGIGIGQPRPQIGPRTPPRKLGKPQAQPRRR